MVAFMKDEFTPSAKRQYVRLAPVQWAEVEAHWKSGEATLTELSERFGPSTRALQAHFAKRGIVKGEAASALVESVRAAITSEALARPDELVERAKDVRERAYRNASRLEDLVMSQLAIAERDPTQVLRVSAGLKALSLAAGALERLHGLKLRALGLDRVDAVPDEMPVLEIVGLTEEDCKRIRSSHGDDDDFGGALTIHTPAPMRTGTSSNDDDIVALGDD